MFRHVEIHFTREPEPRPLNEVQARVRSSVMEPKDLDAYGRYRPNLKLADVEYRLTHGHVGVLGWLDDRIVGENWGCVGRAHVRFLHADILLADEEELRQRGSTRYARILI